MEYDTDAAVRRISHKGDLKFQGERIFISEIFGHQALGLRAVDDRYYEVLYGPLVIGWVDGFQHRFHRRPPRPLRN